MPTPTLTDSPFPMIKVCGVTREEDLHVLAESGVTTVGINFVATSPRCVSMAEGAALAAVARQLGLLTAAVVRDTNEKQLSKLLDTVQLDFLQLHGGERPELLAALNAQSNRPQIIKALSWSGQASECEAAAAWRQYATQPGSRFAAWLIDAYSPSIGGGTGQLADWHRLVPRPEVLSTHPVILAGGLAPHNVRTAISSVRPQGVDTASGVETSPGLKSSELVRMFASEAQAAFGE